MGAARIVSERTLITYLYSSLFDSPAQTLVNMVNTVGVMGKGVAKVFKATYPAMFREYKKVCDARELSIGKLHLWKGPDRWVLNVPTKTTWQLPSKLEYVEAALKRFISRYEDMGITSVSFPPLGCGNGGLPWSEVRPLMEAHLKSLRIPVYIHNVQVPLNYKPEHMENIIPPESLEAFWQDVCATISRRTGKFQTLEQKTPFFVSPVAERSIYIQHESGKGELLDFEAIESAWVALRDGILSIDRYPDGKSRRTKTYLFPILADLPYVENAQIARMGFEGRNKASGLFFKCRRAPTKMPTTGYQECLSL